MCLPFTTKDRAWAGGQFARPAIFQSGSFAGTVERRLACEAALHSYGESLLIKFVTLPTFSGVTKLGPVRIKSFLGKAPCFA
jgi:hypothetical protein